MKPELEELPSRESNKVRRIRGNKGNGMPYSVVRRWIRSKVGESFESVLSQWVKLEWIPARFRSYSEFKRYVETEVVDGGDGKFYYASCFMGRLIPVDNISQTVFVNPKNHKLTLSKPIKRGSNWKKKREEELSKRFIRIGDHHHYCKIDGIWYEVILKDHFFVTRYDPVARECYQERRNVEKNTPLTDVSAYKMSRFFVLKREQLNSKKLKDLGLSNER